MFNIRSRSVLQSGYPLGYKITLEDDLILFDMTAGALSAALPAVASAKGFSVRCKKVDSSANALTITGTIDGATNLVISSQNSVFMLYCDGAVWWIVGSN